METRKEAIMRMEPISLVMQGRVAHIEDMIDVALDTQKIPRIEQDEPTGSVSD